MPRVSDEHRAARRQQILNAAQTCFLRDGFHSTSMQDVIAEAGLSVGAVYRYFSSKDELIRAIAQSAIGGASNVLNDVVAQEPPLPLLAVLHRALGYIETQSGPDGVLRIAMQVWAESLRDPALGEFVGETYRGFQARFTEIADRAKQSGELPPDADPAAVGTALFGMVAGYILQRILTGRPDRQTYLAGIRALLPPGELDP